MPTPLELLTDPISIAIMAMYALLMIWEAVFPARRLPAIRNWKTKGIIFFFLFFFLSSYLPLMYEHLLPGTQLVDLSSMSIGLSAVAGIVIYETGIYFWHRAMHRNNLLWKIFHQMHHSAERLDTFGAFYFSPFDMAGFTLLGTVCFSLVAGLPAQAVTIILLVTNFFSIFQHANIKTPTWVGYIIQRPESHAIHHGRGIHAFNYSDLPLLDIIFGTFRNPEQYVKETGFYHGASEKITDMLLFRDVSREEKEKQKEEARELEQAIF